MSTLKLARRVSWRSFFFFNKLLLVVHKWNAGRVARGGVARRSRAFYVLTLGSVRLLQLERWMALSFRHRPNFYPKCSRELK